MKLSEWNFDVYLSIALHMRPMLLLWNPPSDCLVDSHQALAAEQHQHSPLKDAAPAALESLVPAAAASASPSRSSGSSSSRNSKNQAEFSRGICSRDNKLCVVCEGDTVEGAHIVPLKAERSSGLRHDHRVKRTACAPAHLENEARTEGALACFPQRLADE